jgi:endonuclease/exonuclease/phosphatase (EEP) superfamily protein YafD
MTELRPFPAPVCSAAPTVRIVAVAPVLLAVGALALGRTAGAELIGLGRPLFAALGIAALLVAARAGTRPGAVALLGALLLVAWWRPALPRAAACPPGAADYRVVAWNLWEQNADPEASVRFLAGSDADALLLLEAKGGAAAVPPALRARYPYQAACHARAFCSTLVLTRQAPDAVVPLARGDPENRQALSAVLVRLAGGPILIAVHLSRPWPRGRQARELSLLTPHAAAGAVVAGDFNATADMPAFRAFVRRTGLGLATPPGASWPARLPEGPALPLLAIDQLLVGEGWAASARLGPALGSDHRPIVADLCRR